MSAPAQSNAELIGAYLDGVIRKDALQVSRPRRGGIRPGGSWLIATCGIGHNLQLATHTSEA